MTLSSRLDDPWTSKDPWDEPSVDDPTTDPGFLGTHSDGNIYLDATSKGTFLLYLSGNPESPFELQGIQDVLDLLEQLDDLNLVEAHPLLGGVPTAA